MKGGQPQVQSQTLDPKSQSFVDRMRQLATQFAGSGGMDPGTSGAMDFWKTLTSAGATGAGALTGNPTDVNAFMNPYFQSLDPVFDRMRQASLKAVDQNATLEGAFGGTRTGVAEGEALRGVNDIQAQTGYQGFQDAMTRALSAMGLGQNASSMLFGAPQRFQGGILGLLNQGLGPVGQQTSTSTQWSPLMTLLGLAMTPFGGGTGLLGLHHAAAGGS